jgi:hypothetical protein
MIIGNLRSRKDYETKMNEYQNILNVAINNKKNLQQQQHTINYNTVNNIPTPPPILERPPTEIVQDDYPRPHPNLLII